MSILATFFLRFFHLSRRKFEGGYTCDFHLALVTGQNLKKSNHLRKQKIARVAAALVTCSSCLNDVHLYSQLIAVYKTGAITCVCCQNIVLFGKIKEKIFKLCL